MLQKSAEEKLVAKRRVRPEVQGVFNPLSKGVWAGGLAKWIAALSLSWAITGFAADKPAATPSTNSTTNQTNSSTVGTLKSMVEGALTNIKETVEQKPDDSKVLHLLDGNSLENFYTWIEGSGTFMDPRGVFTVSDGVLRISGEKVGYLATRKEYSDYHLIAEYKWGEHQSIGKKEMKRNSGLLIHGMGEDKEWMKGIECQIAEGRTGNVVLHNGAKLSLGTNFFSKPWTELGSTKQEFEFLPGKWNTLEVISVGARLQVLVNGKLSIDAGNVMPNRGKILLQSNGSEILFRKLDLLPVDTLRNPFVEVTVTNIVDGKTIITTNAPARVVK